MSKPVRGKIVNYRIGIRTQKSREGLIKFDHINSSSKAGQLIGRKVMWKEGENKIIGTLVSLHGKKGLIRARFRKGVPGQALGTSVELIGMLTLAPPVTTKKRENDRSEQVTATSFQELTNIEGIGVKRAEKLKAIGVRSIQDLASSNPNKLAKELKVSEKTLTKWVTQANNAVKKNR